jgi:phenylacetic acid degradation operon negative regulatory protein
LRHFHRQSPIRGGSLLITIFGDSIAPRGGAITLGSLISLAQPFELTERLVRTSVARLASDGWLIARRDGRRSEYRLSPTGLARFAEATGRIYGEIPSSWDGQWTLLILPTGAQRRESHEALAARRGATGARPKRQDVRDELRWLGFGQVSPGVFAHPNWSVEQARAALNGLDGAADALLLKSESEGSEADRRLVASGWDLGDLARRYRRFVDIFAPVLEALRPRTPPTRHGPAATDPACATDDAIGDTTGSASGSAPGSASGNTTGSPIGSAPGSVTDNAPGSATCADGALPAEAAFIIRTLLIHEYRKIHLQDPLLPQALLPSDWVGAAAYDLSKQLYSAVFAAAERYLSDTASTMTEPLPPAGEPAYARFGGLKA